MPNTTNFSASTTNAQVTGTLTDREISQPVAPIPGLQAIGPRVTFNFITEPWSSSNTYQYYDVVNVDGSSYVARQNVPTGVQLTNTDYWFLWNNPNAQLSEVQNQLQSVANDVTQLKSSQVPQNHASTSTTYGVGTPTQYGHVKLYSSVGAQTDGAPTGAAVNSAIKSAVSDVVPDLSDYFPVETVNIANGAVTAQKLATGSVSTSALASGAVTNAKLGVGSVGTSNLQMSSVNNAILAPGCVTSDKLADNLIDNIFSGLEVRIFGNVDGINDNTGASYPEYTYVKGAYVPALQMLSIWRLGCDYRSTWNADNPIILPSYVPEMTFDESMIGAIAFGGVDWSDSNYFATWYAINIRGRQLVCNREASTNNFVGVPFTIFCQGNTSANSTSVSTVAQALSNNPAYGA